MALRVGEYQPIPDIKDPYIQEIAEFAATAAGLNLVRVVSGEQQVVAGMNYKLVIVAEDATGARGMWEVVVYDKPWEKFRELISIRPVPSHQTAHRVGEYQPIPDVNDPYIQEIAEFAAKAAGLKLVRVVSGEQQLVAGTNYKLVILAEDAAGVRSTWEVVVYDKPWEKLRDLISIRPVPGRKTAHRVGEYQPIPDVKDPYIQEIAEFAANAAGMKLVRVVSGEQQLVAGTNYKLVIVAEDAAGTRSTWEVVVYDKPWEKLRELISIRPVPGQKTAHRVGEYQPIPDINDPYIQEIAEFVANAVGLKLVRVVSGEQQVVAGTNYKLVIVMEDATGTRSTWEVVVYDKPWEKLRELISIRPVPVQKTSRRVGVYQPIPDIKDPYVQEIAEFAAKAAGLKLVRVVSGEEQLVAGTNYKLVIVAEDAAGARSSWEVVVYDRPWEKVRELISIKPVPGQQNDRVVKRGKWYQPMCCGKA